MTFLRVLNKPHYVFRPRQALVRLRSGRLSTTVPRDVLVRLPWGLDLMVQTTDAVGHVVERTGVFDPAVSETVLRLADPGDLAVDVGANVGYMTSLLAVGLGATGKVICFEPQPDVRGALVENVKRWKDQGLIAEIEVRSEALSSRSGIGYMTRAPLGHSRDGQRLQDGESVGIADTFEVPLVALDEMLDRDARVGVLKVDVEGHELDVLLGSEGLLRRGAIRDILVEEHGTYPTPVTNLLERHGYALFKLDHSLFGPWTGAASSSRQTMTDQSFLATLDPRRARDRLKKRGWMIFRPGGRRRRGRVTGS
ncbi:MAG: FkbM family methyltransferase [Actinomycetota bacterium]|nr:FkbM family methyltransferase [Actinomycetota bacterium]